MTTKPVKKDIAGSLTALERVVAWFDEQDQVDVEAGLAKVREGAVLVKELKSRLKEVANEFEEVKKELEAHENEA
jgi:hypothetical protein